MAMASPVVMAKRLSRLTLAGPPPGPVDRKEIVRMVTEKLDASGESIRTTATGITKANQQFLHILMLSAGDGVGLRCERLTNSVLTSSLQIVDQSIAPFHRRVTSNARRLSNQ
jgi:hypothetical protein